MESVDSIRMCPTDPKRAERLAARSTSYVINDYLTTPGPNAILSLYKLKATSKTITVFEGSDVRSADPALEHAHCSLWFSPLNVARHKVYSELVKDIQPDRHSAVAHYLYADGHVDSISDEKIFEWSESGHDFALPE